MGQFTTNMLGEEAFRSFSPRIPLVMYYGIGSQWLRSMERKKPTWNEAKMMRARLVGDSL